VRGCVRCLASTTFPVINSDQIRGVCNHSTMEIVGFYRSIRTEHVAMATKPTNAHKHIEVFCIINIIVLLHVSATLVDVLRVYITTILYIYVLVLVSLPHLISQYKFMFLCRALLYSCVM
jgi:hypothetical protein